MNTALYVAAGGGGDALAALMLARAIEDDGRLPTVVSYSWDRYLIDPAPGPRHVRDFEGLRRLTDHTWQVIADSGLRAGGTSGLSLLARHTPARFVLMDPALGAVGIRQQLRELIDHLSVDQVTLVDVGGDVAAHGDEATLLSPLADSLALAAVVELPVPAVVAIVGLGLDGELPEDRVRDDLLGIGAETRKLAAVHVRPYLSTLEHHPSEATMLTAAAALGVTGRAEIRDKGALVALHARSADAFLAAPDAVLGLNTVAQKLTDTQSLDQADTITREVCGHTELDHERRKAQALAHHRPPEPGAAELRARFQEYRRAAASRGADLVSFRRLTEVLGMRHYDPPSMRALIGDFAFPDLPLCRIVPGSAYTDG
jgi:hypothetical protein